VKHTPAPPRLARRLLARALPADVRDDVSGDLEEVFRRRQESAGAFRARLWYWREALSFTVHFGRERLRGRPGAAGSGEPVAGGGRTPARLSWLDVKLGLRILAKYPGLTLISAVGIALAVALAASWFAFSQDLLNPVLPLEEGDRIVRIQTLDANTSAPEPRQLHEFETWRRELGSVSDLTAGMPLEVRIGGAAGRPETVRGMRVTASMFRLTRVPPLLGRPLLEADEEPSAAAAVVIGYDLWQRMFAGDRAVIGRAVRLGAGQSTIVGVMPSGFGFPVNQEVWLPLRERAVDYARRDGPAVTVVGRLAAGTTLEEAQAELTTLGTRAAAEFPATNERLRPRVGPMIEFGEEAIIARAMNLAFILLLAVVCANVATLVFARTVTREGEIALRTALGASRRRIVLQLATEALVLTAVAAALGLAIAGVGLEWGMDLFWDVQQSRPPFWFDAGLDPVTVLYVAGLTLLGAAIIGVVPALKATGSRIQPQLTLLAAGGSRLKFGVGSTVIVVAQVALSVTLLPLAIIVGRDMMPEREAAAGLPVDSFLAGRLTRITDVPPSAMAAAERTAFLARTAALQDDALRRLAAEPGVAAITYADRLPGMNHPLERILFDGDVAGADTADLSVRALSVDPEFFSVMNAPVVAGRAFRRADIDADLPVVVVGQSFAREHLGGRNAVGQRIRYPTRPDEAGERWYEIVGVVQDPAIVTYGAGSYVGMYRPLGPGDRSALTFFARPAEHADLTSVRIYSVIDAVDSSLAVDELMTLQEVWSPVRRSDRFFTIAIAAVSTLALLFSLAGIYALMTFTVAQRAREIAIRAALGAQPRRIVAAIFSRALAQIGIGVAIGATLISLTAVESPGGAGIVAGVAALMMGIGIAACAVPAVRALRIHPADAFRES
jgi:predicted permease